MKKSYAWSLILVCLMTTLGIAGDQSISPQNYCGIYAVYGAIHAEGGELDFQSLLNRKYMSCPKGSSIQELEKAAVDHGMNASVLTNMTPSLLVRCKKPVILYVRSSVATGSFDHYILFLKYSDNKYSCIDADKVRSLSEVELLTIWSGVGMVVSKNPIQPMALTWPIWAEQGCILALLLVGGFLLKRLFTVKNPLAAQSPAGSHTWPGITFVLVAVVTVSTIYHHASAVGLYSSENRVAEVEAAYSGQFISKISVARAHSLHEAGQAVFIDARLPADFAAGHIQGALSVPVNIGEKEFTDAMKGIPQDQRIVVYCQSRDCPYAKVVCSMLTRNGFLKLSIYRDGWEGWHDKDS